MTFGQPGRVRGRHPRGVSGDSDVTMVLLQTTAQALAHNTVIPIQYDTVVQDTHGIFQGADPDTFVFPISGTWGLSFVTQWTHNNTGERYIQLFVEGDSAAFNNEGSFARDGADLGGFSLEVDAYFQVDAEAGQRVELRAFQNSGIQLDFVINVVGPRFIMSLIRPF